MTGPVEPSRPDDEPEAASGESGSAASERTGWPVRPVHSPGSPLRPESFRIGPQGSSPGWTGPARPGPASAQERPTERLERPAPPQERPLDRPAPPAGPGGSGAAPAPVRPPVPTGVPPRSQPLPPPRETSGTRPAPAVAGSLAGATVVPDRPPRRPPPRPGGSGATRAVRGRKARLAVRRLDPWSVFVTSLVLSLLLAVVTIVASFLLYGVLSLMGVPESVNDNLGDIAQKGDLLTQGKFVGVAALIGGANVVFLTGLATLGSMLYNVIAGFTGGVELTLSEKE